MTGTIKIDFDFEKKEFRHITVDQVKFWESVFPDVDVIHHLEHRMPAWLDGNPSRAKKNYKRFIVNWLSAQQERYSQFKGGDHGNH